MSRTGLVIKRGSLLSGSLLLSRPTFHSVVTRNEPAGALICVQSTLLLVRQVIMFPPLSL